MWHFFSIKNKDSTHGAKENGTPYLGQNVKHQYPEVEDFIANLKKIMHTVIFYVKTFFNFNVITVSIYGWLFGVDTN